jgi:hypothetical protein
VVNRQTSVSRASRNIFPNSRVLSASEAEANRRFNSATVIGSSHRKYGTADAEFKSVERKLFIKFYAHNPRNPRLNFLKY